MKMMVCDTDSETKMQDRKDSDALNTNAAEGNFHGAKLCSCSTMVLISLYKTIFNEHSEKSTKILKDSEDFIYDVSINFFHPTSIKV